VQGPECKPQYRKEEKGRKERKKEVNLSSQNPISKTPSQRRAGVLV
jgi:hypothetical protein